jgi:hypothetical protein
MKKFAFALMVAVVMAGSVAMFAAAPASGPQDFTLINKTGLTIDELYVSPTATNDWEEDILGVDTLANGGKVDITFAPDTAHCSYDVKIVDEDGDAVVWTKIDLCKAEEITLLYQGGKPTAIIK